MVIIAEENNEDQKQVSTKTNKKERKRKDGKKGKKGLETEENLSFLPNSGVDIELSNESKQKLRKRSDYKIRLKYSENNGKRLGYRMGRNSNHTFFKIKIFLNTYLIEILFSI